jgi:hypothetical protein
MNIKKVKVVKKYDKCVSCDKKKEENKMQYCDDCILRLFKMYHEDYNLLHLIGKSNI